ncbi:MAG: alpha/beta hydrolase [Betaproteobacteria bacterium]|nr:alpha/beta hydrolase [Pseudomonadota bacterium]
MLPMSNLPEAARRAMAQIGPVWGSDIQKHRDMVIAAYAPLLAQSPKDGCSAIRDIAYGAHPRQVLDVFKPDVARGVKGAKGAPVVIFVHGGAFVRGDRNVDAEIYSNTLWWFARKGVIGINMEYRLAPEAMYPGGAEDVGAAVAWARAHAAEYGGDPDKIFLIGHSAGGTHAAGYAFDPAIRPAAGHGLAGLILISARVRADVEAENPNAFAVKAYFGEDASLYERRSPVTHAAGSKLPTFIVIAEFENPLLDVYGAELLHRMSVAARRAPRFMRLTRHNHTSIVAHFNTGEDLLGNEILDFIATGR